MRTHLTIDRSADTVWAVVSDAANISCWFPSVQASEAIGGERHRVLEGGVPPGPRHKGLVRERKA
ncbi:MAG: SRPBCC family protein [Mycobacterium sp.]|nr:SRPBCC family protein [Mycobacterium sp.]